ncbi:tripartite tricarboxylate transporter TctB family protein [Labrenzia sp. CE80]|uniref:tripartite tricarboxylate transporter TctB family protein n=1 Tax=Labrenzia sp. CE80 TaxID=1788986 RepID=UPI00129AF3B0|nr:tripartite tricarboxylate transporter TctB family protein [Labrenzia sp. CE80]
MISREVKKSPAFMFAVTVLVLACLALVFMGSLVAAPKLLFGRSLTAISPDSFPTVILILMALLCVLQVGMQVRGFQIESGPALGKNGWYRGTYFFAILTGYALLMVPLGFQVSSTVATALLSVQMGNRNWAQIAVLSICGPSLLYLGATRLLAVSLPELNVIELAYGSLLGG